MFLWCKLILQQYTMVSFFHVLSSLQLSCMCLKMLSLAKSFFQCFLISHKLLLLFTQRYLFLLMAQPYLLTKVILFFPWVTVCRTICFQNQITVLNELLVSSRPSTSWQHSAVISPIWPVTADPTQASAGKENAQKCKSHIGTLWMCDPKCHFHLYIRNWQDRLELMYIWAQQCFPQDRDNLTASM